jgi:hypothetical protein
MKAYSFSAYFMVARFGVGQVLNPFRVWGGVESGPRAAPWVKYIKPFGVGQVLDPFRVWGGLESGPRAAPWVKYI